MIRVCCTLAQMDILASVIACGLQTGDVVCLNGVVGAGKSTLARAIIHHLVGNSVAVPSPTFTLVQTYDSPVGAIWHMDWYRLNHPEEVFELGVEEAFYTAISLIEWSEKASDYIPHDSIQVTLIGTGDTRTIDIQTYKNRHAHMGDRCQKLDFITRS